VLLIDFNPQGNATTGAGIFKRDQAVHQAAIELALQNVTAHHARVEHLQGRYAVITSRAFAELKDFVALTRHLLAPGGRWLAMKGQRPTAELAALPAGIVAEAVQSLAAPGLAAERHLVVLRERD
jgi:16S rRNA (guanine527-N7)-methyltransferase